jgi:signal transduction histidine kinase
MGLNMVADAVLMTAAIYYTGGPVSPLVAVYVIEVTVVALLSNVGITLMVAGGVLGCYGTMCGLVAAGSLPPTLPPGLGDVGGLDVLVFMAFAAFAIGVPTFLTLKIVAQLRHKETVLEARTAELIEAGKQRSVFLASVTHELRTPIHGVQGLADLISGGVYGPTTDKQRDAAASIKRSAQSLLHLIDDLLALVRADVGRLEVKVAPVDLCELVEQVVASVQWMLGTKKLTLTSEVGPHDEDDVVTDRRLLGQILVNLVANAAKFTPQGGKVTVRAFVERDRLVLEVADTGIGIPDDKREAIFEAFKQLDASDERTYGGVGLGLALVRRLCDLLGGVVSVESVVQKGSTFRVSLPARADGFADGTASGVGWEVDGGEM